MTYRRWTIRVGLWGIAVLLLPCGAAVGADVSVRAVVNQGEVYLGESVRLDVVIEGIPDSAQPEVGAVAEVFDLVYAGTRTNMSSSFSLIINGRQVRRSGESTVTHSYYLTPREGGRQMIPAVSLIHKGKTYKSNPIHLRVKVPEPQDVVLLEVAAGQSEYWVEEPFALTLKVFVRKLDREGQVIGTEPLMPSQPPHLEIPWFAGLEGCESPDLQQWAQPYVVRQSQPGFEINDYQDRSSVFLFDRTMMRFGLPQGDDTRPGLDGRLHDYHVYTLTKEFLPTQSGLLVIPPVQFKGRIPTRVDRRMKVLAADEVRVSSPMIKLSIKPPPVESQPESFCGAIGPVRLRVTAKPTKVRVMDPITLNMQISGRARLEAVGAPRLTANDALMTNFKVPEETSAGVAVAGGKRFTQSIRPVSEDVTEIPPIEIAYFDPQDGEYHTVRSKLIRLEVSPADKLSMSNVIGATPSAQTIELTEVAGGILANYPDSSALLVSQAFVPGWSWATGPVSGAALYFVLWFVQSRRRRLAEDVAFARRRGAARKASASLAGAGAHSAETVGQSLLTYVADRCNKPSGGLTRADAVRELERRQVSKEAVDLVDQLLTDCEMAAYAGVDEGGDNPADRARRCITVLEKQRF